MTDTGVPQHRVAIQDVSAWILRIGVILSVTVMLTGLLVSFLHNHVDVARMQHSTFEYRPSLVWQGVRQVRGKAIIEVGIYLLVFTPILRVFASMVLFIVEERDWFYGLITFLVLILTLTGLILLR